ncbi:MAG: HlyD family efflux transporter periplasmic adaptor subunit [Melioribacteraceae bacterium]
MKIKMINKLAMQKFSLLILLLLVTVACSNDGDLSDAYGNFEATATTVSAEANGRLLFFDIEEGQKLSVGSLIGLVDTTQLHLQRKQLQASIGTLPKKLRNTIADISVLQNKKSNLTRERDRIKRLVEKKAATTKQLDDLNGSVDVIEKQITALRSQTNTSNRAILAEKEPLLAKIDVVNEKIRKSYIKSPVDGTILTKLAEAHEMVRVGSPLYRIAKLETLTLRFYVDAVQLQGLKREQQIQVLIDKGEDDFTELEGTITWISDQAEFTPKTIQTKEDRVNLVYAIKAIVANEDGIIKIGMPAEINFTKKEID